MLKMIHPLAFRQDNASRLRVLAAKMDSSAWVPSMRMTVAIALKPSRIPVQHSLQEDQHCNNL
jgi:hypothetical protein